MAKLEIKKKPDAKSGLSLSEYDILIDGHEPSMIRGIQMDLHCDEVNVAKLEFLVDDFKCDAEFLTLLKAKIDEDTKAE